VAGADLAAAAAVAGIGAGLVVVAAAGMAVALARQADQLGEGAGAAPEVRVDFRRADHRCQLRATVGQVADIVPAGNKL